MAKELTHHGEDIMATLNTVCDHRNEEGYIDFDLFNNLDGSIGKALDHNGHWSVEVAREVAEQTGAAKAMRADIERARACHDELDLEGGDMQLNGALKVAAELLFGTEQANELLAGLL